MPQRVGSTELTERLADQVFEALSIVLEGFDAAAQRDGVELPAEQVHPGSLTVLLRLVFVLYAEERGLLPVELSGLFEELQRDRQDPEAMDRRFGAWSRLLASWRAIHEGVPPRGGQLFDPDAHPILEALSIDDGTIHRVLDALLHLREGNTRQRLCYRALEVEQIGSVYEALMGYEERRRTSSHYTPRELTEPVVRRTLAPLLRTTEAPSSEAILSLKIVDPAMGSGAFLVEVVRQLGDHVVAAWQREGRLDEHAEPVIAARSLVAQRCVYGVDKNHYAVNLAKLSVWLVTMARDQPFTFVDHALRHGDSLLGLSLAQARAFDWREGGDAVLALEHEALEDARMAADLCLSAFFAASNDKERLVERARRLELLMSWMRARGRGEPAGELRAAIEGLRAQLLDRQAPFHWMLEFPEVFCEGRGFDAVVGNPPFMGGSQLSGAFGDGYRDWLLHLHAQSHGNSDLCAHFFRRAATLLGEHGSFGLVATNTIGQGDTRRTGLAALLAEGAIIHDATTDLRWPAAGAAVTVSIVHGAIGRVCDSLDGAVLRRVSAADGWHEAVRTRAINSRLEPRPERANPVALAANDGLSSLGSKIYGEGFTLTPARREILLARDRRNAGRIKPYLGGAEVNRNPDQGFERYAIDFGTLTLEEAERWPDLLNIVEATVRAERSKLRDTAINRTLKKYWWRYWAHRPDLYAALAKLPRCLVTARVTKHPCFSWQPTDRILNEKLVVIPLAQSSALAILQSRIHGQWCWGLSSTRKTDLNYSPTDCFQNFAFPGPDPRTKHARLEALGEQLDALRSRFMLDHGIGLTTTYNLLLGFDSHKHHDAATDPRLASLRELHLSLDHAVLHSYVENLAASRDPNERELGSRFRAIEVPAYVDPRLPNLASARRLALERFKHAILDALLALNERRAAKERGS